MAGLTRFTVLYGSQEPLSHAIMRLDEARDEAQDEASAHLTRDPAGNVIALSACAALSA